jgi:hypothetical protein
MSNLILSADTYRLIYAYYHSRAGFIPWPVDEQSHRAWAVAASVDPRDMRVAAHPSLLYVPDIGRWGAGLSVTALYF